MTPNQLACEIAEQAILLAGIAGQHRWPILDQSAPPLTDDDEQAVKVRLRAIAEEVATRG